MEDLDRRFYESYDRKENEKWGSGTYNDTNMGRPSGPRLEAAQHLQQIVLRVRGKGIPPSVYTDARTTWDIVVEPHVRGFRLVELHVPVAVRWNFLAKLLAKTDLSESRAIRWEGPGRESSRT